ncbi:MAG: hypothetical protein WCP60_06230, partial [bacterium]
DECFLLVFILRSSISAHDLLNTFYFDKKEPPNGSSPFSEFDARKATFSHCASCGRSVAHPAIG